MPDRHVGWAMIRGMTSHEISRIEITRQLEPDGSDTFTYTVSDGMTYMETIGLLEAAKLTISDEYLLNVALADEGDGDDD